MRLLFSVWALLVVAFPAAAQTDEEAALIHPAEALNISAANSLRKTLDEPRGETVLILVSHDTGRLPVPMFCAGGIATPADAALVMQLGAEAVFVGSGIFKSSDPSGMAKAVVEATLNYEDPSILAKVSRGLGKAMPGLEIGTLDTKLADRGW